MEHNQYAVYSVRVNGTKRLSTFKDQEYVNLGVTDNSEVITVVAPDDEELANILMSYSLKSESWDKEKFFFEILEKKKIKHILRFEDAYRARF